MSVEARLWSGPRLLVPITIDALVLGRPNLASAREDFTQVGPDYAQLRDDLGGSPTPAPFQATSGLGMPRVGATLHWTLPPGLREGEFSPASGSVEFPKLPNRWLIVRISHSGRPHAAGEAAPSLRAWLLRSDAIDNQRGSVPWPTQGGDAPFEWMGVRIDLGAALGDEASSTPRLRALGPGNPAFAQLAQSSDNVLAFHDSLADVEPDAAVSYFAAGYFNPAAWDPLLGRGDEAPEGFTDTEQWAERLEQLRLQIGEGGGPDDLEAAKQAWRSWAATHGVDPSQLPAAQRELAGQLLMFGAVQEIAWRGPDHAYRQAVPDPRAIEVAVGDTATEALGAWLDDKLRARELADYSIERLVAALMHGELTSFMSDVAGFENQLHARRFSSAPGGQAWVVQRAEGSEASGRVDLPLDQHQSRQLVELNAAQRTLDATERALASRSWERFAAAWKLERAPAAHRPRVEQSFERLTRERDELELALSQRRSEVAGRRAALAAALAPDFELSAAPLDAFRAPSDPVILVAAAAIDDKLNQRDGDQREVDLPCRFTGQTLRALGFLLPDGGPQQLTAEQLTAELELGWLTESGVPTEVGDLLLEALLLDPGLVDWLASRWRAGDPRRADVELSEVSNAIARVQSSFRAAAALDEVLSPALVAAVTGSEGEPPAPLAHQSWDPDAQPWTPLFIDWEVEWHPSAATSEHEQQLDEWQLAEVDFSWRGIFAGGQQAAVYFGRTLLSGDAPRALADRIDALLARFADELELPEFERRDLEAAASALRHADVLTQSLAGLSDQLIQRRIDVAAGGLAGLDDQLAPEFAAVPAPPTQADGSDRPFSPLRAGHFVIKRLWLVDAWGQTLRTEVDGGRVVPTFAENLRTPGVGNRPYGQLAPRLVQSARMDLRLVTAADDAIATTSADDSSPICGWLVVNALDGGLLVFDAHGQALGQLLPVTRDLGTGVRWDAAPGRDIPLGSPVTAETVQNRHLRGVLAGLLAAGRRGTAALDELVALIDGASFLHRPAAEDELAGPLLVGQPVAVVRATVQLELAGDPVYDQSFAATGEGQTAGALELPIPVRIGDLGLRDNGVVGCYAGDRYDRVFAAHGYSPVASGLARGLRQRGSLAAVLGQGFGEPVASGAYVLSDQPLELRGHRHTADILVDPPPPAPGPEVLTVLMFPAGQLPIITGYMPVERRSLPPGPVRAALRAMAPSFRVGPLLVDPGAIDMPLPAEIRGSWDFLRRDSVTSWSAQAPGDRGEQALLSDRALELSEGHLRLSARVDEREPTDTP